MARCFVGITGASGVVYGIRLLRVLDREKHLVISDGAKEVIRHETGLTARDVEALADRAYGNDDLAAPVASGSFPLDAVFIVPCSMNTLAKLACGISDNLISRVGAIAMKERRPLVIVPRETPLSTIHLRHMASLSEMGVRVLPAAPAFYGRPRKVDDMVDFIVGRVLDAVGMPHRLYRRWTGPTGRSRRT